MSKKMVVAPKESVHTVKAVKKRLADSLWE